MYIYARLTQNKYKIKYKRKQRTKSNKKAKQKAKNKKKAILAKQKEQHMKLNMDSNTYC